MMKLLVLCFFAFSIRARAIENNPQKNSDCTGSVTPSPNFVVNNFIGVWYEVQKFSSQFDGGKCISVNVGTLRLTNSSIVTMKYSQRVGVTTTNFDQNATISAINSVWAFNYNRSLTVRANGSIVILDTNYVNYAVAYACGRINNVRNGVMVWILSRTRTLQPDFLNRAMSVLAVNKIPTRSLIVSDQSNCSTGINGL